MPQATGGLRGASSFAGVARLEVALVGKLRRLPRHVGVGPDGVANEPLLAVLDRRGHWPGKMSRTMRLRSSMVGALSRLSLCL